MTLEGKPRHRSTVKRTDCSTLPLVLAAMENTVNAIVITDRAGIIQWTNAAFCELAGYGAHEMPGRNIRILNSGRHPKSFFRDMWNGLLRGCSWRGSLINRRKDGAEYINNVTISPVAIAAGDPSHFVSIRQDQEAPLTSAPDTRSQRNQIAAAAGQFACGIAPDLDRYLTVIKKNTESLINRPEFSPEAGEYSERIVHAGDQAAALAGWLLAFSRRQAQEFRAVDLNGLIVGLRRHLQAILPQNIELKIALAPALGNPIGDENAIEEALIHLVVNARDAMPEGGTLLIETASLHRGASGPEKSSRGYALLRVTDTGIGMDAATQDHIFEPFYTTKLETSGAGLGLSAVYGIVKQAGGWISVYTEKGVGSSIEIFLPCDEDVANPSRDQGAF